MLNISACPLHRAFMYFPERSRAEVDPELPDWNCAGPLLHGYFSFFFYKDVFQ